MSFDIEKRKDISEQCKFYLKSNRCCTVCGKYIEDYRKCYASKTKRKTYVVAHINCINKYII